MLRGVVSYVIIGHSERRHIFLEHDNDIRQKIQAVIRNGMNPILCIGETSVERAAGETFDVLQGQLNAGLANVTSEEIERMVIAYEPVWAIGTGQNARPEDVDDAARYIRDHVSALYGKKAAAAVRVLYGGSVDAYNANSYLQVKDIDGLLVGGASLKADAFVRIIEAAHQLQGEENKVKVRKTA